MQENELVKKSYFTTTQALNQFLLYIMMSLEVTL